MLCSSRCSQALLTCVSALATLGMARLTQQQSQPSPPPPQQQQAVAGAPLGMASSEDLPVESRWQAACLRALLRQRALEALGLAQVRRGAPCTPELALCWPGSGGSAGALRDVQTRRLVTDWPQVTALVDSCTALGWAPSKRQWAALGFFARQAVATCSASAAAQLLFAAAKLCGNVPGARHLPPTWTRAVFQHVMRECRGASSECLCHRTITLRRG